MKILKALTVGGLFCLLAVGCSSVMPGPEVEQVGTDPVALTGTDTTGTTSLTITFVCKNHIDAIITNNRVVCNGATSQTLSYRTNLYIPADGSEVELVIDWDSASLEALRAAIGYDANNQRTMTFYFSGTDAYGYDKTFTVREFTVSF